MTTTTATGTGVLWDAERRLADRLGYRLFVKIEQQHNLTLMGADTELVAVCRLVPTGPSARLVCAAQQADAIHAEQRFRDQRDAVFATGDAIRAALQLAKDAA